MPIEWDAKTQMWSLGATLHRAYAVVDNTQYPLRLVPNKAAAEAGDQVKFADLVDRMSPAAMVPDVYVVNKVIGKRTKAGETEFKVLWRGYSIQQQGLHLGA